MLSNIAVKQSMNLPDAGKAKFDATPETGTEFDFMDYLLGLQAQPSDEDMASATSVDSLNLNLQDGDSKEKDITQDGAFALASLFPGMTGLTNPTPEKTEDGNSIIPADLSNGMDLSNAQVLNGAEDKTQVEANANPMLDEATGKIPDLGVKGLETDRLAGMRAFQSQLAAQEPVETKERENDEDSSVEGVDLSLSQLGQTFELKPQGETLTAAAKDSEASQPTQLPELFSKVETLARNGGGTMKVTLNPPELGQVEVEVTTRGNQVQVELKSESGSAKSILESRLGDLKASIQSHDLVVSKLEVNIDHELGRQNSSMSMMGNWNQQQQHSQFSQASRNPFSEFSGNNRMSERVAASRAPRVETPVLAPRINHGRVDVRV